MSDGKKNPYFLDDALDWLRDHVTDAPEDAIARALIKALDETGGLEGIEIALDVNMGGHPYFGPMTPPQESGRR
jgi:hypothetical protein